MLIPGIVPLAFETGTLATLEGLSDWFRPASEPWRPPISVFTDTDYRCLPPSPTFPAASGNLIQILTLAWQALYPP